MFSRRAAEDVPDASASVEIREASTERALVVKPETVFFFRDASASVEIREAASTERAPIAVLPDMSSTSEEEFRCRVSTARAVTVLPSASASDEFKGEVSTTAVSLSSDAEPDAFCPRLASSEECTGADALSNNGKPEPLVPRTAAETLAAKASAEMLISCPETAELMTDGLISRPESVAVPLSSIPVLEEPCRRLLCDIGRTMMPTRASSAAS